MSKTKIMLIAVILLPILIGFMIWGVMRESTRIKPITKTQNELQVNSEELIGITMKIPGGNRNGYWELSCAKMVNANHYGTLTTIKGQYYRAHKPVYYLDAKSGVIYWGTSVLKLRGDVKFSVKDGSVLTADEIVWDPKSEMIKAKNNVHLTTRNSEVITEQITAKPDLRKVNLKGTTQVIYND